MWNTFEEMAKSKQDKSKGERHSWLKFNSKHGKKPKMELQGHLKKYHTPNIWWGKWSRNESMYTQYQQIV